VNLFAVAAPILSHTIWRFEHEMQYIRSICMNNVSVFRQCHLEELLLPELYRMEILAMYKCKVAEKVMT